MDAKGRIAIPTRYRSELQECCERQMIVTVAMDDRCSGVEGCLWLFPLPEWEMVEQKIEKLPALNKMTIKLRRFLIGHATECEMDGHGRLLIPGRLRKLAKLEKRLVLLGQLNKFEIWNEENFNDEEDDWLNGTDTEGLEALGKLSF